MGKILWTWKEKYLDCEIETRVISPSVTCASALKRKVSRLRDWNNRLRSSLRTLASVLEKKSISIARLKPHPHRHRKDTSTSLKRKVSRLRDWNSDDAGHKGRTDALEKKSISIARLKHGCQRAFVYAIVFLKRKVSRLRDWNDNLKHFFSIIKCAWKEKYLDCEIETVSISDDVKNSSILEKKSISIARLKLCQKENRTYLFRLEKKSISIARLKRIGFYPPDLPIRLSWTSILKRKVSRLRDWNISLSDTRSSVSFSWKEKYLDCEIETNNMHCIWMITKTWKEKYLDCEIETLMESRGIHF